MLGKHDAAVGSVVWCPETSEGESGFAADEQDTEAFDATDTVISGSWDSTVSVWDP